MPDIAEIAARSGIAARKLRYVLDHGLLPAGEAASRGRGAARSLTPFEAVGVALAAWMLEAGLRRALVRDCLALLCRPAGPRRASPLERALGGDGDASLEVGDWRHVRLVAADASRGTPWLTLDGGGAPEAYAPLVTVAVDVGQLRRRAGGTP